MSDRIRPPRARRNRRALAGLLLTGVSWASMLAAQQASSAITLGGVRLLYVDTLDAGAATLSPSLSLTWPRANANVSGTYSHFGTGEWVAQGSVGGGGYLSLKPWLSAELGGFAAGSTHDGGGGTGQTLALARTHFMKRNAGFWLGGALGRAWDGQAGNGLRQLEAGVWARVDRGNVIASVTPVALGDSVRYTDTQLLGYWPWNRVELSATAGYRAGSRLPSYGTEERFWGNAQLVWWAGSRIALVAGAGTYPVDLTQGFPGGRYATIGVRLSSRRQVNPPRWTSQQADQLARSSATGVTDFQIGRTDSARTVKVRAPSAASVDLRGDFTRWETVSLTPQGDGWWIASLPIDAGIYQVSIRLNQGDWLVPPGLVAMVDEFGGVAGIVVIEDRTL